ncbi:MAG TPA: hypothetical protein VGO50_19615 [Pyrinomonadaceae bacterium]|jgi:hypothetical protein|nr:hypothetical protein [Pyrinomonadaceae bacterium]
MKFIKYLPLLITLIFFTISDEQAQAKPPVQEIPTLKESEGLESQGRFDNFHPVKRNAEDRPSWAGGALRPAW